MGAISRILTFSLATLAIGLTRDNMAAVPKVTAVPLECRVPLAQAPGPAGSIVGAAESSTTPPGLRGTTSSGNRVDKRIAIGPRIDSIDPTVGSLDTQVLIIGQEFTCATRVLFGTDAAIFHVNDDRHIVA